MNNLKMNKEKDKVGKLAKRIIIGGGIFILLFAGLMFLIGDNKTFGSILSLIFIIAWLIFAYFIIRYFILMLKSWFK